MGVISSPWPNKEPHVSGIGTGGSAKYDEVISKALADDLLEARGGSKGGSNDMKPRGVVESVQERPSGK